MGTLIVSILLFLAVADICLYLLIYRTFPNMRFLPFMFGCLGIQYILYILNNLNFQLKDTQSVVSMPLAIYALSFFFMFLWEYIGQKRLKPLFIVFILIVPTLELFAFFYKSFYQLPDFFYHRMWQFTNLGLTIIFMFLYVYRAQKVRIRKTEHKNLITVSLLVFLLLSALVGYTLGHPHGNPATKSFIGYSFDAIDLLIIGFLYFHLFGLYKSKLEKEKKLRLQALYPLMDFHKKNFTPDNKESRKQNTGNTQILLAEDYNKNDTSPGNLPDMGKRIIQFFNEHTEVYLDSDFKLATLISHTDIPRALIPRIFSEELHTTFNEYLNKRRITEAQHILSERKDITTTELAEVCGYKSRASFYKHFKLVTGKSITAYRKDL